MALDGCRSERGGTDRLLSAMESRVVGLVSIDAIDCGDFLSFALGARCGLESGRFGICVGNDFLYGHFFLAKYHSGFAL